MTTKTIEGNEGTGPGQIGRRSMLAGLAGLTAVAAVAGTASVGAPARAAAAAGFAVAAKFTYLRSSASWTGAQVRGLPTGTLLQVRGAVSGGWLPVQVGAALGWVHTTTATAPVAGPGTIALRSATARYSTSDATGAVGAVSMGSKVETTGRVSGDWTQVLVQGSAGWVPTAGLGLMNAAVLSLDTADTTKATYLRSSPSWTGGHVLYLTAGARVGLTGKVNGSWSEATAAGRTGWLNTAMLSPARQAAPRPPAGTRPSTAHKVPFSAAGMSSWYSVYAEGIDWSKPVGVAWYFDGDYSYETSVRVESPTGTWMTGIAAAAAARNMVLVAPRTPSYDRGYTWWVNKWANFDWFLPLAQKIFADHTMLVPSRQLLIGYSGGSEFIASVLMAQRQFEWMQPGEIVTTIVGGGTKPKVIEGTNEEFRKSWLNWHVADDDDYTAAMSGWSAEAAATGGELMYRTVGGYTRTLLDVIPAVGLGHYGYDFPALLTADLERAGIPAIR